MPERQGRASVISLLVMGLIAFGALAAGDAGVAQDAGSLDAGALARDAGPEVTGEWPDSNSPTDLVDTALKNGELTGFVRAVAEADLAEWLKGAGPYTVLAPSDAAFAKLKTKEFGKLLADKERLRRVLLMHVMPGRLSLSDLKKLRSGDRLPTFLDGRRLKLTVKSNRISFDRAVVIKGDIDASNGLLHIVDTVLTP